VFFSEGATEYGCSQLVLLGSTRSIPRQLVLTLPYGLPYLAAALVKS